MTSRGGKSFLRDWRRRSTRFLALRRLARSGSTVITTSSAASSVFFIQAVQACGTSRIDGGHAGLRDVDHLREGALVEIVGAVEGRRRGKQAEVVRAAGEQAIEEHVVEAIGRVHRLGDALRRDPG